MRSYSVFVRYRIYSWHGTNRLGENCQGEILATNRQKVREILRAKEVIVRGINLSWQQIILSKSSLITRKDLLFFTQQMTAILQAGFTFLQALRLASHYQQNKLMQRLMQELDLEVEAGASFSALIGRHPEVFNNLYRNLIAVGESSDSLQVVFARLSDYLLQQQLFKQRLQKVLFYPTILILISIAVVICILLFVVPQFQSLYASLDSDLPWSTNIVISFARWMQSYAMAILSIASIAIIGLSKAYTLSVSFVKLIDKLIFKLPIIGGVIHKFILGRFVNTLYIAYSSGISLLASLNHAKLVVNNTIYTRFIDDLISRVTAGESLRSGLLATGFFPKHLINILSVGDAAANLEEMLKYLACYYDRDIENMLNRFNNILEPFIMLILGAVVGFLVLAIYYPIIKLGAIV